MSSPVSKLIAAGGPSKKKQRSLTTPKNLCKEKFCVLASIDNKSPRVNSKMKKKVCVAEPRPSPVASSTEMKVHFSPVDSPLVSFHVDSTAFSISTPSGSEKKLAPKEVVDSIESFVKKEKEEDDYNSAEQHLKGKSPDSEPKSPDSKPTHTGDTASTGHYCGGTPPGETSPEQHELDFMQEMACFNCGQYPCVTDEFNDECVEQINLFEEMFGGIDNMSAMDRREARHNICRFWIKQIHGCLGRGNRKQLPTCVVESIRSEFPDPNNNYKGYRMEGYIHYVDSDKDDGDDSDSDQFQI